ncbi:hypothetical protein QFZ31_002301 [Neobacillus niacini]|uniref:hypothetical protein n=1 Tax=Neobacillus driksii TaxID=3035913 RepID=UPI0027877C63|nr:hypothetical protein [Neobacillus niacini]MDQ0972423.1 hypothetical protein [Neobacillus niacini]
MSADMKIVASSILKEFGREKYVYGDISYLTWHDENALIDYDYLYERVEFVEDWLHDKLTYNSKYKNLSEVRLNVKYFQIGSVIYTVENHQTKQIKKAISNESLTLDEDIINTKGFIVYGMDLEDLPC